MEAYREKFSCSVQVLDPPRPTQGCREAASGPRILFFSGGTALSRLSQTLIRYTHNSIHLVTPFDSGGSSAKLRQAFHMPSVGDIRNRLIALADRSIPGIPEVCQLFAFRFPRTGTLGDLRARLERIVWGNDPLVTRVPPPARPVIRHYLQSFFTRMPSDFDLRGASLGNLVIAGGYLRCGRRMEPVIRRLSHLCAVRGTVRPVVNGSFHLVAQLQDGRRLVGQHLLTGKEVPPIPVPVVQVYLTRESRQDRPVEVTISPAVKRLIREAELICYPMGSFYSSLIANLLPRGVGEAIQENPCPKIYLPNVGADPEQLGLSLSRCVETLLAYLQRGCSRPVPAEKLLHFVLIDSRHAQAFPPRECARIRRMGIELLDRPLITGQSTPCWDEERLVPLLLSLLKER